MVTFQPEKVFKMFESMCNRHKGEMLSAVLDWEILEISHPRYEGKIQQVVPLLVIDFK